MATLDHLAAGDGRSVDGAGAEPLDLAARCLEARNVGCDLPGLGILLLLARAFVRALDVDGGHASLLSACKAFFASSYSLPRISVMRGMALLVEA